MRQSEMKLKYQWILTAIDDEGHTVTREEGWANSLDYTSHIVLLKSRFPSVVRVVVDIALPVR